jgi:hypothetical protein
MAAEIFCFSMSAALCNIRNLFQVLLTLSFLATGSYQKLVGLSHKTPQRTVSRFVKEVVEALKCPKMIKKWMPFPTTLQDRAKIKTKSVLLSTCMILYGEHRKTIVVI